MRIYLILFKYGNEYHIDVFKLEKEYDPEKDRIVLRDVARSAVDQLDFKKEGYNIYDVSLYEIKLIIDPEYGAYAAFSGEPIDAVEIVKTSSYGSQETIE